MTTFTPMDTYDSPQFLFGYDANDLSSPRNNEEKRAHHNALERKRRDIIKVSFEALRDAIPNLEGEKASRAQILNTATEVIVRIKDKTTHVENENLTLKKKNEALQAEIARLEAELGEVPSTTTELPSVQPTAATIDPSCLTGGSSS
eukprot:Colp12_sorted_trinity150504_noHs@13523